MDVTHVDGKDKGKVMLYALSTCGWCQKTKTLLGELGVAYDYIDVDQLQGAERQAVIAEIEKFNPDCNFPSLALGDGRYIIGYKETDIRQELG
jgi:glutaredoxin